MEEIGKQKKLINSYCGDEKEKDNTKKEKGKKNENFYPHIDFDPEMMYTPHTEPEPEPEPMIEFDDDCFGGDEGFGDYLGAKSEEGEGEGEDEEEEKQSIFVIFSNILYHRS